MKKREVLEKFSVSTKDDLYTTILVKNNSICNFDNTYERHTPFGVAKNVETFKSYLNMLSTEEIMRYRDNMDGNILHDMCDCDKGVEYFKILMNRIGESNFKELIRLEDRSGMQPLVQISNLELFKYMFSFTRMNSRLLSQLALNSRNRKIIEYLANLINLSK